MFVSCECCVFVRQKSLHLVDYMSKRVLPSVVCPSVMANPVRGGHYLKSGHSTMEGGVGSACVGGYTDYTE